MTNRVGASITEVDFAEHIGTTKFEYCVDSSAKVKIFLGVENIQPRVGDPKIPKPGHDANDYDAPYPGFTPKQYERLALPYVVASARRGQWLIPAFHGVIDHFYRDGHDDPQHFDMSAFSAAVEKHVVALAPTMTLGATHEIVKAQEGIPKWDLPPLDAATCRSIAANASSFKLEKTTRTTQYFTPLFQSGPDGGLRDEDRKNCLQVEGSCIVGNFLYNAGGPNGTRYERDKVPFIFGKGSGKSTFNTTNAPFPCRTLAADSDKYDSGTVVYIPSMVGKICPQNNQPVDGCFIVGDVGSAIKGKGRFDVFTGECSRYDGKHNVCRDQGNAAFEVPKEAEFRVVPRESPQAEALRKEVDSFISNGWQPVSP